jgi:hypothetical protein
MRNERAEGGPPQYTQYVSEAVVDVRHEKRYVKGIERRISKHS